MLIEIILLIITTCVAIFVAYLTRILIGNYYGQQVLQKHLPELPIMDGVRLLGGHAYVMLDQKSWRLFDDAQKKLGKHVGFYWNDIACICTTDIDLLKQIVIDQGNENLNRIFDIRVAFEEMEVDNIGAARDDDWRRLRKVFSSALSKHRIMSPNVLDEIQRVINRFNDSIDWRLQRSAKESGPNFIVEDMDDLCHRFSLDSIFTSFYKQESTIDYFAIKDHWQVSTNQIYMQVINKFAQICIMIPMFSYLMRILVNFHPPIAKTRATLKKFVEQQTELYLEAKKQMEAKKRTDPTLIINEDNFIMTDGTNFKQNLVDHITKSFLKGAMTKGEYINSSIFLFLAANKPAADALSRLIYLLASNQEIQDKLRKSISLEGIDSGYLMWVINEALRLFPPVLLGCARHLSRDVNMELGIIPKGTFILPNTWAIHRSPEYWGTDANEFRPERWAHSDSFHPLQFIPFGGGRRGCPGKDLALLEMRMLLLKLIQLYRFERSEKTDNSMEYMSPFLVAIILGQPNWIKISRLEAQT